MQKHVIFVMEGGGAKGPFEIGVIETIETKLGKMCADIVDAFVTTSIGTVNGGILATKTMWAYEIAKLMLEKLPWIFKKNFLQLPIYDRNRYIKLYEEVVEKRFGKKILMKDVDDKTHFIVTSTNMCDGLNHFFKSDKEGEKELPITDVTCKSFAAPYYFGQINDNVDRSIWLDGGCGVENMPLWQAYVEAWRRCWFNDGHHTHILAIGCGYSKFWIDYEDGSKGNMLQQTIRAIRYFNSIISGSLARNQSVAVQVRTMKALSNAQSNFSFQYVDWPGVMSSKLDKMDNIDARFEYYETGKKVGDLVDLSKLI